MRVAVVSDQFSEKEQVPESGFVRLAGAGPASSQLVGCLREIRPHLVTVDAPSQAELRLVRLAVEDIRTGDDAYPVQLLVTGCQEQPSADEHVDPEPAGDEARLSLRAAHALAGTSLPRLLYIDDDANQLIRPINGEPFVKDTWVIPMLFRQELARGVPASWQLPENGVALDQLLCLANCKRQRPPYVLLDINLHDPMVTIGVAAALLSWTNAVIQPLSGYGQLPTFVERAPLLAEIFGHDRLLLPCSKKEIHALKGKEVLEFIARRGGDLLPASRFASDPNLRWERVARKYQKLAALSLFEWNMPWELVGRGQEGWGFKGRTSEKARPQSGYLWERKKRLSDVPPGWLESAAPDLLTDGQNRSSVFPLFAFPAAHHKLLSAMTACLGAIQPPVSIEQLIERAATQHLSTWVGFNQTRLKRLHPLSAVRKRIANSLEKGNPVRPIEAMSDENALLADSLAGAVRTGASVLGVAMERMDSVWEDVILLLLLGSLELLRAGQNGETKAGASGKVVRWMDHLFTCLETKNRNWWPLPGGNVEIQLTSQERQRWEQAPERRQQELQLLVTLTLALR